MRKSLVIPLLLPLIGLAAVKGYYWFQVKESVDRIIAQVAPYGELSYQSVIASFDGQAGIEGVVFRPRMGEIELTAQRVVMVADSWTVFLSGAAVLRKEQLPAGLQLRIERVHADSRQLEFVSPRAVGSDAMLGCERAGEGGLSFWRALGYGPLYANLEVGYRFDVRNGYLNLRAKVDAPSVFTIDATSSIATGQAQLQPHALWASAKLSEIALKVQDNSYNQRRNSYCAGLNHESVAAYVNRHVDLLVNRYQVRGVRFGDEMIDGYRKFLLTRGSAELQLVAKQPIPFQSLDFNLLPEQFAARLRINGEAIRPLDFAWRAPEQPALAAGGLMKVADQQPVTAIEGNLTAQLAEQPVPVKKQPAPDDAGDDDPYHLTQVRRVAKPTYQVVAVPELPNFIGERMQVDTLNGHRIQGVLDSVAKNQLRLKQEFDGGEAVLPIRFDLIRTLRVLR